MNQNVNVITKNAFRLNPSQAEYFSDIIATAMKKEAVQLHYAGRDDIVWRPMNDSPAKRPSTRALRREEILLHLDQRRWRSTSLLCNMLGRSGSAMRAMLHRMREEGLVEYREAQHGRVEWRQAKPNGKGR